MKRSLITIGLAVILVAVFAVFLIRAGQKVEVPENINKKINFQAFIIKAQSPEFMTDESSFKFDDKQQVFSFIITDDSSKITVTEQAYPEVLILDKLVGTLNQYDEIQTKSGRVALTRPKTADGNQVAVVNVNNQTLIFARATKDLTNTQWQQFFNNLEALK